MPESQVIIVGAGTSGLSAAACLHLHFIPYIILEREDCFASIWKKYGYDRLHLHLRKQVCALAHMPFPETYPKYVPREDFVKYIDEYASHFKIRPIYRRSVELAEYDEGRGRWVVQARNLESGEMEEFAGRFLVVASGESANPRIPGDIEGLSNFKGEAIHSTEYKNGKSYRDKSVLVVGSGNSGWEIAFDLENHGARTSIVVRSPMNILTRWMIDLPAPKLVLKYIPFQWLDRLMVMLSKLYFGDLTKYGIRRPAEGPFLCKMKYGKFPILDVGTCAKIKSGKIQVLPAIRSVRGSEVLFENGKAHSFDAMILCTGFKRTTNIWLKGGDSVLNEDGLAKQGPPNNWKGDKGLYCCGLAQRGFAGANVDANNIANDIKSLLNV